MRILLFISIFIPLTFISQSGYQDFGVWGSLSAGKEVADGLKVSGDIQLRTDDNSTRLNQYFFDLGVKYKINKYLRTGVSWRSRMTNDWDNYKYQNRLYFDLAGKLKVGDVALYMRSRTQTTSNKNSENPLYERMRFKAKVKIDKGLKAFVQDEFFIHLNGASSSKYKKNRFGIGMEYDLSKNIEVVIKYLRITEVNQYYPLKMNVLAIGVSYSIE